ncbi:MAG: hypothetical protein RSD51_03380 [Malacoplasma sp.]
MNKNLQEKLNILKKILSNKDNKQTLINLFIMELELANKIIYNENDSISMDWNYSIASAFQNTALTDYITSPASDDNIIEYNNFKDLYFAIETDYKNTVDQLLTLPHDFIYFDDIFNYLSRKF